MGIYCEYIASTTKPKGQNDQNKILFYFVENPGETQVLYMLFENTYVVVPAFKIKCYDETFVLHILGKCLKSFEPDREFEKEPIDIT